MVLFQTLLVSALPDDVKEEEGDDEALWSSMEVVQAAKLKRKSKAESGRELRQAQIEGTSSDGSNKFKHSQLASELNPERKAKNKKKIRSE